MMLAKPGDPLVDATGKIVEARGRAEPDYSLTVPDATKLRTRHARSVRELGTDPQTQTIVNAVLGYKLLGISSNEIAHHLGTTPLDVEKVMQLAAYQDTFAMIFNELIAASSNSLQARLSAYAGKALTNVMDLADTKPIKVTRKDDAGNEYEKDEYTVPPIVIYKANENLLDRAGLAAEHLFGRAAQSETPQLEIEITSADDNKTDVKVNIKTGR